MAWRFLWSLSFVLLAADAASAFFQGPAAPSPEHGASLGISFDDPASIPPPPAAPSQSLACSEVFGPSVWGIVGARIYPYGERTGPNGVEFAQLFSIDSDFNIWLCRDQRVYLFLETHFWGQKPGAGITNVHQGNFDFSKREFDFNAGLAWNYSGSWEARFFGYSSNNLNRGTSLASPAGFNDGVGIENRYYIGSTYRDLGTSAFDLARATFVSLGFYPSKEMVDTEGNLFRPGPFARAYLTYDCYEPWKSYLFGDLKLLGDRNFAPKQFQSNIGVASRPFATIPRLEFRLGLDELLDMPSWDRQTSVYFEVRYIY